VTQLIDEVRRIRRLPSPPMAREIRRAAAVSQSRLAAELGVHRVTVTRWELGTRAPRGEVRLAYAALLEDLRHEVLTS
jgi:DNA-binding transcriptional regulator YiaG